MGAVVASLIQVTVSLAGVAFDLGTVFAGLISLCLGPALLSSLGLGAAIDAQESVVKLAGNYLGRIEEARETQTWQKVFSVLLLLPVALLIWIASLQCHLGMRAVAVPAQYTLKLAPSLLVANVALLFVLPRHSWMLMKAVGIVSPIISWGLAEHAKKQGIVGAREAMEEVDAEPKESSDAANDAPDDADGS
eukprot:TRINITY_DN3046_c0_g4_i1.p1 TRINITY_DN3046_c0_g4~~TRINITY_DN3046_c0_g4_i1.p1  ORF type:complete len:192 (-),score=38.65 TRINITY_DN3046_c0_g4_i1:42-617(-)